MDGGPIVTLRHLYIFKMVSQHMNITKAAEEMNMTQPAVSMAVKELEVFYNARMFDRVGRRIYLTPAGEKLLRYTRSILAEFDDSVTDIRDASGLKICRIGANVTLSESYLPDILSQLKTILPFLSLRVYINNNYKIEDHLSNNSIDLALLDSPGDLPNRTVEKVFSENMHLVCAPSFTDKESVTMEELSEMPLLLRENGSGCRRCVDRGFKKAGIKPLIAAESISNKTLIRLAEDGYGITVTSQISAQESIDQGKLKRVRLTDGKFSRQYYLEYLSHKYKSSTIKLCLDGIKQYFADLPDTV